MEWGKTLIDQDFVSKEGESIHSTITLLHKDGSLIDNWAQDFHKRYK